VQNEKGRSCRKKYDDCMQFACGNVTNRISRSGGKKKKDYLFSEFYACFTYLLRLPKITLKWMPKQKRTRGRPKKNGMEGIRKAMNERNLNEGQWEDRKQWSLGVGQRWTTFWNRHTYIHLLIYILNYLLNYLFTYSLTYLLTYSFHAAEPFLRS